MIETRIEGVCIYFEKSHPLLVVLYGRRFQSTVAIALLALLLLFMLLTLSHVVLELLLHFLPFVALLLFFLLLTLSRVVGKHGVRFWRAFLRRSKNSNSNLVLVSRYHVGEQIPRW